MKEEDGKEGRWEGRKLDELEVLVRIQAQYKELNNKMNLDMDI